MGLQPHPPDVDRTETLAERFCMFFASVVFHRNKADESTNAKEQVAFGQIDHGGKTDYCILVVLFPLK
jgi:hypothetical protein